MQQKKRFLLPLLVLILGCSPSVEAQSNSPETLAKSDDEVARPELRKEQRDAPRSTQQNLATIRRLAELRRELKIAESSSRARIVLPSDLLFDESAPSEIDHFAIPVLTKIAEFLRLTDKRNMTLTSFYLPKEGGERSVAQNHIIGLVQWFETTGKLPTNLLQCAPPTPIETDTANIGGQNRIEINLAWEQVSRPAE